jgi:hypothetical protein
MNCRETEVHITVLARLTALLGDNVFFVPCERGTKKPLVAYVERNSRGSGTSFQRR